MGLAVEEHNFDVEKDDETEEALILFGNGIDIVGVGGSSGSSESESESEGTTSVEMKSVKTFGLRDLLDRCIATKCV